MVQFEQCEFCGKEVFHEDAVFVYLGVVYIQCAEREVRVHDEQLIFCTPACAGKHLRDRTAEA